MPRVPANGVSLYCETAGHGPPLVLVHGFACGLRTWDPQVSAFARFRRWAGCSPERRPLVDVERLKRRLKDALEELDAERPVDSDGLANRLEALAVDRGGDPSLEFHAKQIRAARMTPLVSGGR